MASYKIKKRENRREQIMLNKAIWGDAEQKKLLEYLKKRKPIEKPTQKIYYRNFLKENKINIDWTLLRYKVKNLKTSYTKAKQLLATLQVDKKTLVKKCRHYDDLKEILDFNINPAADKALDAKNKNSDSYQNGTSITACTTNFVQVLSDDTNNSQESLLDLKQQRYEYDKQIREDELLLKQMELDVRRKQLHFEQEKHVKELPERADEEFIDIKTENSELHQYDSSLTPCATIFEPILCDDNCIEPTAVRPEQNTASDLDNTNNGHNGLLNLREEELLLREIELDIRREQLHFDKEKHDKELSERPTEEVLAVENENSELHRNDSSSTPCTTNFEPVLCDGNGLEPPAKNANHNTIVNTKNTNNSQSSLLDLKRQKFEYDKEMRKEELLLKQMELDVRRQQLYFERVKHAKELEQREKFKMLDISFQRERLEKELALQEKMALKTLDMKERLAWKGIQNSF